MLVGCSRRSSPPSGRQPHEAGRDPHSRRQQRVTASSSSGSPPTASRSRRTALLVEIETSKAVLEVVAPESGYLLQLARQGSEVSLTAPIALLFPDLTALTEYEEKQAAAKAADEALGVGPRATVKAVARAAELGVDLSTVHSEGLITVKEVEAAAAAQAPVSYDDAASPAHRARRRAAGPADRRRAGRHPGHRHLRRFGRAAGGGGDRGREPREVGHRGQRRAGRRPSDRLAALFAEGAFDAVVIAISSVGAGPHEVPGAVRASRGAAGQRDRPDGQARHGRRDRDRQRHLRVLPLRRRGTDRRQQLLLGLQLVRPPLGAGRRHLHRPGRDGLGTGHAVGNRVRLGTGIFIEPKLELGDDVIVASGATILRSVPADHAVKTKVVTTTTVPRRR